MDEDENSISGKFQLIEVVNALMQMVYVVFSCVFYNLNDSSEHIKSVEIGCENS